MHVFLPHPTLAGNTVTIGMRSTGGVPDTVTDDGDANAWEMLESDTDGGGDFVSMWRKQVATGTRRVTVGFTPTTRDHVQVELVEWCGIKATSPKDVSNKAHANSASWAPGILTPTVDGDVIYSLGVTTSGVDALSFTAQPGFKLISVNLTDTFASQWQYQTVKAAVTPTMTRDASDTFICCGVALKTDTSQGTALPADVVRIRGVQWHDVQTVINPVVFQFPSMGMLLVASWMGFLSGAPDLPVYITSITDNKKNKWDWQTGLRSSGADGQLCQFPWAKRPVTAHDLTLSVVFDLPTGGSSTLALYDIDNVDPDDPIGNFAVAESFVADTGVTTLTTVSLTTQRPRVMVLNVTGVGAPSLRSLVGAGYLVDNPWAPEENGGPSALHENNGWGHYYAPAKSTTVTFVYDKSSGDQVGGMASLAMAINGELKPDPYATKRRPMRVQELFDGEE